MLSKQLFLVFATLVITAGIVSARRGGGGRGGPPKGPTPLGGSKPCHAEVVPNDGSTLPTEECAEGFTCNFGPFTKTHGEKTVSVKFCVGEDNACPSPLEDGADPKQRLEEAGCKIVQPDDEGYASGRPVCNASGKYVVYSCPEGEGGDRRGGRRPGSGRPGSGRRGRGGGGRRQEG